jgi:hypothetical protein
MLGGAWFSAGMVALLFGGWVYNKFYRSTGGNSKNALVAAGIAGFLVFLIMGSILSFLLTRFG